MTKTEPSNGCSLCDLPTPDPPVTATDVTGSFCCQGCLEVSRALAGEYEDLDEEHVQDVVTGATETDEIPPDATTEFLSVEGMHCSTCERFLEGIATSREGIEAADASYATELMRVAYNESVVDAEELPDHVSGYGYRATIQELEDGSEEHGGAQVAKILAGGGFFGMMVMMYYVLFIYPRYFGYNPLFELEGYVGLWLFAQIWLFTSAALFWTGKPILRGAYVSLTARQPNTDLLLTLAALGAYIYSTIAIGLGRTDLYFDVTIAIVLVTTAGNWYETRTRRKATGLLSGLVGDTIDTAIRHGDGETVSLADLEPGDQVRVPPGETIPVDGSVIAGTAAVDESLMTGEPIPAERSPGDDVHGGTLVTDSMLVVEVGDEVTSTRERLIETLWHIQSTSHGVQRLADKLAVVFVPLVLVIATAVLGVTLWVGFEPTTALIASLTVLIVACPCALGLATPLSVASGLAAAAKEGIVVTGRDAFEKAGDVDVLALDKTGTITAGEMTVESVVGEDDILEQAGTIEEYSPHPVGRAIAAELDEPAGDVTDFTRHRLGVEGRLNGERVVVGHPDLFEERGWTIPDRLRSAGESIREDGQVPVVVGWDKTVRGVIAVGDQQRDAWDDLVAKLGPDHEIVVLTGDEGASADRLRESPHVDEVFAGVPPEAKAETVTRLKQRGTVAMVGDGTNDAPALAAADIGIAMGGGTALANEAGDVVIADDDLRSVPTVFSIMSKTKRRTQENLGWAFLYNAVAIPVAVAGLLNPLLAAAAMVSSSILVVANSTRSLVIDE